MALPRLEARELGLFGPERVLVHGQEQRGPPRRERAEGSSGLELKSATAEARGSQKSSRLDLKRGRERPSGQRAFLATARAPCRCCSCLCAGRPIPVSWAGSLLSLAFCRRAPLAAWREGQPCKEGESPCLRTCGGGNGALPDPSPACKQARAFSQPSGFVPVSGRWAALPPVAGAHGRLFPCCAPGAPQCAEPPVAFPQCRGLSAAFLPGLAVGMSARHVGCTELAPSSGTVLPSPVFPLVGTSERMG